MSGSNLTGKQKRYLKGLAHHHKAIVTIGSNGISESVLREVDQALARHELIKIKLPALASDERKRLMDSICSATDAALVQALGRIGVFYRASDPPQITLPD